MSEIPLIIVPDPDDPDAAEVFVDGTVNGRPRRFLLDTGAARTRLVADSTLSDLPSLAQEESSGALAVVANELIHIKNLAVGPLAARDLVVSRVAANQVGARDLVGMDVLRHFSLRLQLAKSQLTLETPSQSDAALPLVTSGRHHPYVELTWPGVSARACLDTGASVTVVNQAFLDEHADLFEREGSSVGTDANGGQLETPTYRMLGPVIGGLPFEAHSVVALDLSAMNATTDLAMDFIVGYPTLRQADWTLDFPRRRWAAARLA